MHISARKLRKINKTYRRGGLDALAAMHKRPVRPAPCVITPERVAAFREEMRRLGG